MKVWDLQARAETPSWDTVLRNRQGPGSILINPFTCLPCLPSDAGFQG